MKRIAAIAAMTVALGTAVPATAMASTDSPAPGPGPVQVPVPAKCLPPGGVIFRGPVKVKPVKQVKPPVGVIKPVRGKPVAVLVLGCCGLKLPRNAPGTVHACRAQVVEFDMAAGSSVVTEVHGPRLHAGERLLYQRQAYTVRTVWGREFDVDQHGTLVVNNGPAIHDGTALVIGRGITIITLTPAPPPGR
jgi:hypothetical protein